MKKLITTGLAVSFVALGTASFAATADSLVGAVTNAPAAYCGLDTNITTDITGYNQLIDDIGNNGDHLATLVDGLVYTYDGPTSKHLLTDSTNTLDVTLVSYLVDSVTMQTSNNLDDYSGAAPNGIINAKLDGVATVIDETAAATAITDGTIGITVDTTVFSTSTGFDQVVDGDTLTWIFTCVTND